MAVSFQNANIDTISTVNNLVHEVYVNRVEPHYAYMDPVAGIFKEARNEQDYKVIGKKLVGSADLLFAGGAIASDGNLPDHEYVDPVPWETTPARMYIQRAVDDFLTARAVQPGAFEDLMGRIERQSVEAFQRMTCRHVHGSSNATICVVSSRTSSTVLVVKDGLGHVGTNPLLFVRKGMKMVLLDNGNSYAILGAAKVSSVDYANKSITFAASIEGGGTAAAGMVLCFIGSTDSSSGAYKAERGYAPLGFRDMLDPDGNNSSYLTIAEATYPEIKPVRKTCVDFTEVEFMEFVAEIEANGQTSVTDTSHVFTCQKGVQIELAKTLVGYTQIMGKGQELNGGWTTVKIGNFDFVISGYHTHDEVMAHCLADYVVAPLGGSNVDGEIASPDGNQYARLPGFDGRSWYMRAWLARWMTRRNRSGVLKGISSPNADKYAAVPR
jgi:hypothetical protein